MNKYDKRRKYYIVLDCETATLPEAINYDGEERKNIAIAKPPTTAAIIAVPLHIFVLVMVLTFTLRVSL